jgi:uncharacterized SAM-binding protein YcdF (DUF218 family)
MASAAPTAMSRLVAVLGYSRGSATELHPVCAARLARAEAEATPDDIVLFSGWRRRGLPATEADLMASSWSVPVRRKLVDRSARTTLGNAIGVGRAARQHGVDEVTFVTSRWHARRAGVLVRASLRGSGTVLRAVTTDEPTSARRSLRELVAWTLVPLLAAIAVRTR